MQGIKPLILDSPANMQYVHQLNYPYNVKPSSQTLQFPVNPENQNPAAPASSHCL
jgi:hypothetical protein